MFMNKLLTSAAIAMSVAFMWLGFRLAAGTPQVQAAQCWDPGCCGYSLVYNQWSCQSAEASNLCLDMGESPTWVCNSNGLTHPNPGYLPKLYLQRPALRVALSFIRVGVTSA
jgi:hypothetical protein